MELIGTRIKARWMLTVLVGVGLGLFSTGCKPKCEGAEEFPQEVRQGQFAVDDFKEELAHYKRFVREESPGRWVVDTKIQEEKLRNRVRALWNEEDGAHDAASVLRDPLVQEYRSEWAGQGAAFEVAKAELDASLDELETKANAVNDRALAMMSQDGCDGEDLTAGLDVYDRFRELRKQHRRISEVSPGSSASFLEELIAELRLQDGEEPAAGEGGGVQIDVTVIDPSEIDGCGIGGWLFGRVVRIDQRAVLVTSVRNYECPHLVTDEAGTVIGNVVERPDGTRIVVDPATGDELDIPAPACAPTSADRQEAIDLSENELLEALLAELQDPENGFGPTVTVGGETVAVTEINLSVLQQETSAKRMVEICESDLGDPEALAATRNQMMEDLANLVGVAPEDLVGYDGPTQD